MRVFHYPARLKKSAEGGFDVTFRDFSEAFTCGDDRASALAEAADCLAEAVAGRIADQQDIPSPSATKRGEVLVAVPAPIAAKAALILAIRECGLSVAAFARKYKLQETVVRRMLDPKHQTPLARIEAMLERLGKRIVIQVEDAA